MIYSRIKAISKEGEVKFYDTQGYASRDLKIPRTSICSVLNGRQKTSQGYRFERVF